MYDSFHFIRPSLLLLIPVLVLVVWLWMKSKLAKSQWQSILPAHLHQRLVISKGDKQSSLPYMFLMIAMSIACIAMAGPTWEKLPQPVYQSDSGRVVVMDMSLSMRSTDVSPNRLARAKFKGIDLINEINDGEVGLIAYAGDAFTISPLTEDISTLETLIPSLSPEIMPNSGSNPVAALELAITLLENAGYQNGHIYWITDGISLDDVQPLRDLVNASQFEYSALLIGTEDGAPIQLTDGSLLKNNSGAIVIPKINRAYLDQALSSSKAQVTQMSIDDSDIQRMLLASSRLDQIRQNDAQQSTGDAWKDMGAYLVLLLLPIALVLFRKGLLFSVLVALILPIGHSDVAAQTNTAPAAKASQPSPSDTQANASPNLIERLFLNSNQKGQRAFEAGDYENATKAFDDINWQAASAYKAGDYESAAALYQQADGIESIYNYGNALAKLGDLEQAIEAYEKVLARDPQHEDAARNKKILEDLLEQQEQQQNQQQDQNDQQSNEDGEQSDQQDPSEGEGEGQNQDSGEQQDSQQNQEGQNSDEQSQDESSQQDSSQNNSSQEQQENQQAPNESQGTEEEQQNDEQGSQSQADSQGNESTQEPEQEPGSVQAIDQSEMTPEQREQMQRLQTLMNKVPDDPAFLLQRKMQLEAQKRRQFAPPANQEQEW